MMQSTYDCFINYDAQRKHMKEGPRIDTDRVTKMVASKEKKRKKKGK